MQTRLAFAFVALFATTALASGGHFHPKKVAKCSSDCTEDQLKAALPEAIDHLAAWNKIEKSWKAAKVESVTKKTFKKGAEWVLALENGGQKRYVFITLDGYVAGANETGN